MHNFKHFIETSHGEISSMLEKHWEVDHACFRTQTTSEYEELKVVFSVSFNLLIESMVGGRPISTYKLSQPMRVNELFVDLIELPAPKPGKSYPKGYEHLEVVIDISFEELMKKYPSLDWNTSGMKKGLNPELQASFGTFNVKFHHHSLEHIINIEKHSVANSFLEQTDIIKKLSQFKPLISGTIPLGIDLPESDLDILFESLDFDLFNKTVLNHFPSAIISTQDDFTIAKLTHDNLAIELFCQKIAPLKQNAYRHLRIEGRLLKVLGSSFKNRIIELKASGVRTEPAFGQILELSSPYEELLDLYHLSDAELSTRFEKYK